MFKFFTKKKWQLWSWLGSFVILLSLWVQVKIDVKINEWFGVFYDMIQKALAKPDRKSTRLNSSHNPSSRMPSSA